MRYFNYLVMSALLFSACSSKTGTEQQSNETATSEPTNSDFPWDEMTAFVIYAGQTEDDEPNEDFPSLVLKQYDSDKNFMMADNAPILSALMASDMLEQLIAFESGADSTELALVSEVRTWVNTKIDEGYAAFLYELEPPQMAGKAYPLAKEAEAE